MANRVDVYVRNGLTGSMQGDVNVIRQLPDGSSDLQATITYNNTEQIHLPSPDVSLVINAAEGVDIKDYPFHVVSDVDLEIQHSRTDSNWTVRIIPNELPPEVPSTTNVTLGEEEEEG
jgi:hypothetical protein